MNSLFAHVVIVGLSGFLVYLLTWLWTSGQRFLLSVFLGALTALSVYLACIYLFENPMDQTNITMKQIPHRINKAWVTVEGSVSPPGARVFVLVHPYKEPYWWVQQEARKGIQGAWKSDIRIGSPENGGKNYYQIIAVASTNNKIIDAIHNLGIVEGEKLRRPPALPSTDITTVWRSEERR